MAKKKLPRGWVEGSARKFLGLSREESAIIEMRLRLCDEVRSKRLAKGITQQELAARIESTQPRVEARTRGCELRDDDVGVVGAGGESEGDCVGARGGVTTG
jgi:hypothetical protein